MSAGAPRGEQPTITITEFYVTAFDWLDGEQLDKTPDPAHYLMSDFRVGHQIGFAISVFDYEEWGVIHHLLHFNDSTGAGSHRGVDPGFFAKGLLVGRNGSNPPDASDTAAQQETWARIKAAWSNNRHKGGARCSQ